MKPRLATALLASAVVGGDAVRALRRASRSTHRELGASFDRERHLDETMAWLCRAQDSTADRGIAATYTLGTGFTGSYPETTGYLIPTFLDCATARRRPDFRTRALEMGEWLLSIQLPEGAFQASTVRVAPRPSVFNTGQILFGLVRLYRETQDERYLTAIVAAGDWLVDAMDASGAWSRFTYRMTERSYYSRVAWALLEAFEVSGHKRLRDAAVRNLEWVVGNQQPNGWVVHNSFDGASPPFTHTIVYSAEGLLGGGRILQESRYIDAAARIGVALKRKYEAEGRLAGAVDSDWTSRASYTCLTGNSQLAGLLQQLYLLDGERSHLDVATRLCWDVGATQSLTSNNPGVRGGIKGSDPIWGRYMIFRYPNWAAKFFVDALLFEESSRPLARALPGARAGVGPDLGRDPALFSR